MALAAAQPRFLGGEQKFLFFCTCNHDFRQRFSGKRAAGALGVAWGLHLRGEGEQDTKGSVRKQLCTRRSSGWLNSLYKGSDILLTPQHTTLPLPRQPLQTKLGTQLSSQGSLVHCDPTGPILCIPTVVLQQGFQLGDAARAEEGISGLALNFLRSSQGYPCFHTRK